MSTIEALGDDLLKAYEGRGLTVTPNLAPGLTADAQSGGPTPVNLDLRYTTSLADTDACDVVPTSDDLGIGMARIIAPGDAARSVLVARMDLRDINAMPPLGSTVVDAAGVTLITDRINGLANCN